MSSKIELKFLSLELQVVASDMKKNPRGTRVFKTRVSPFYFPSSSSHSSDPGFFFVQIWRSNRPIGAPTFFVLPLFIVPLQICSSSLFFVKSFFLFFLRSAFNRLIKAPTFFVLRSSSIHRSSSLFLFFVKSFFLFFFKSVFLQVPKSSLRDSVLLFRTRVYKTQDLSSIIFPTHQVGIESLILEF